MSPFGSSGPSRRVPTKRSSTSRRSGGSFVSRVIAPKKKTKGASFFVTLAVVLSVLLVAFVLQQTAVLPTSVGTRMPTPDFAKMLGQSADSVSPAGPLEIPDLPQPSYAVGYLRGGHADVAFFRWMKDKGAYVQMANIELKGAGSQIVGMPKLEALRIGTGASTAVLARGSEGPGLEGIYVMALSGDALEPVQQVSADGKYDVAHFLSGASAGHQFSIDFRDVDGDGDVDATVGDAVGEAKTATVYAWKGGVFAYDHKLTEIMTIDRRVFPEPTATPEPLP
jgi:hypothetical protein